MATKKENGRDDLLLEALTRIQGTLVAIHTEARATNERLDAHGAKLDEHSAKFEEQNVRLESVRLELGAMKTELRTEIVAVKTVLSAELAATRTEIAAHRIESNARLDVVGTRLENIRDTMGESVRGQARRIDSVEDRVTRLEQGPR